MVLFAQVPDSVKNGFNIFIALMLFLVMPVIITLAYKFNQRMNAGAGKKKAADNEPEMIEAQLAEAAASEPGSPADAPEENS